MRLLGARRKQAQFGLRALLPGGNPEEGAFLVLLLALELDVCAVVLGEHLLFECFHLCAGLQVALALPTT